MNYTEILSSFQNIGLRSVLNVLCDLVKRV